jgi:hypothetical protein
MDRFRSRRVAAIGAACALALAAAGIVVGAQRAAGQDSGDGLPTGVQYAQGRGDLGEGPQTMRPNADMPAQQGIGQAVSDMPAQMRGGSQTPAIAVGEGAVFVVAHGTLYRFDSKSLALQGSQRIPGSSSAGSLANTPSGGKGASAQGTSGGTTSQDAPAAAQPGAQGTVRELIRRMPPR